MIYRCAHPDDWLTCTASQAFVHLRLSTVSLGLPRHGLFVSCAEGKTCGWCLRVCVQNLLRPQGAETPRPVLWGCPDLSGDRTAAGVGAPLWDGGTGEAALGGRPSGFHPTGRPFSWAAASACPGCASRPGSAPWFADSPG